MFDVIGAARHSDARRHGHGAHFLCAALVASINPIAVHIVEPLYQTMLAFICELNGIYLDILYYSIKLTINFLILFLSQEILCIHIYICINTIG